MKTILFFFLLGIGSVSFSQVYLKPTFYQSTSGNSDGAIKIELMGYSGPVDYQIRSSPSGVSIIPGGIVNSDSVYGVEFSVNGNLPDYIFFAYAFDALTGDTLASFLSEITDQLVGVELTIISSTTSTSCDGSILINNQAGSGVTNGFNYYLSEQGPVWLGAPSSIPGWSNLCPGTRDIHIETASNGNDFFRGSFTVEALTPSQSTPSYVTSVFSTVSSISNCTSTSHALVNGTTSPYQYSWDGAAYSTVDSLENVCPGMHVLKVVDDLNDTLGMNFAVVDSNNYFQNQYTGVGPILDTISFNTQNCSFDYNMAVDSSEITHFEIVAGGAYWEMDIWQGGVLTQVSDTISASFSQTGTNLFSLTFYCGVKSSGGKIYQIIDYINPSELSVNKLNQVSVNVFPNPSNGLVTIEMEGFDSFQLTDLAGRNIMQSDKSSVDLSFLAKGTYVLLIQDVHGNVASERIILK